MDIQELYQEVILDHGRRPRNFGMLEPSTHDAEGYNPLCGDRFHLYLQVSDGVIDQIRFDGTGCAISTASASLMTEAMKGKPVSDFPELFEAVHNMVTGEDPGDHDIGKLAVFGGVSNFPLRVKCATLAWHTMKAALRGDGEVSTE